MGDKTKRTPGKLINFSQVISEDFDLQAGSRGMTVAQAATTFLKSPGHFLAILRFFANEEVEDVSRGTGILAAQLRLFEKGESHPSLEQLTRLGSHFHADLRVLLDVFGHIAEDAAEESMGLAAQFAGELTDEEKLDLKHLVESFSDRNGK